MLDLKFIRENVKQVEDGLTAKNTKVDLKKLMTLDEKRRSTINKVDELRAQKNAANDEISGLLKDKKDPASKIAAMKDIAGQIDQLESQIRDVEGAVNEVLLGIPNLPHSSVPIGGVDQNKIVRTVGEPAKIDFKPQTHLDLAEQLDIVDFKRASKVSGSNFILFKGAGARLERALINFMLDIHTSEHGYTEVFTPFLVNTASMTGTGQLPKMKEDMYKLEGDDLYLIPTAEVPITNIHQGEILKEEDLPIFYTGYSACFRRESGSYGKDTKGLARVHQFDKVELVKFVKPEDSYDELEKLVANAEKILQLLKLPYRVVELASGDLSFAAAKCYDLEAYACGMDKWLEVSSCSNFADFQARRCHIRFKGKEAKKATYVHTLNGSGLALPRIMIAIIENYQTAQGDIAIPDALQPYMGGLKKISETPKS